jgi:hypothetical protein
MALETLSAGEERFEAARRTAGLFLAPAVFLTLLAPLPLAAGPPRLAAILAMMMVDGGRVMAAVADDPGAWPFSLEPPCNP